MSNDTTPSKPADQPKVSAAPALKVGQKAKHANGSTFEVIAILPAGVKLKGVANLVHIDKLTPA